MVVSGVVSDVGQIAEGSAQVLEIFVKKSLVHHFADTLEVSACWVELTSDDPEFQAN